jgi:peptidyl-prolyl cis-trans isomerase A (cyclophilin A)
VKLQGSAQFRWGVVLACAALPALAEPTSAQARDARDGVVHIVIATTAGEIEADLDSLHAPVTVSNFLRYVDTHQYDGGRFHRTVTMTPDNQPANTVKIDVIQGGVAPEHARDAFPPIALERTSISHILHGDGVLSMARGAANSARSDFFITIGAQHSLDFGGQRNVDGEGFAAFGHVVKGADVVRRIQRSAADGQTLTPPVTITRIARVP